MLFPTPPHRRPLALIVLACGLLIGPVASISRADEPDKPSYDQLRRELRRAYKSANYKKALQAAEKMHEQRPGDVDVLYNLACMNCLLRNKAKAYEWLEKAVEAGYADADHLVNDADFRTIRAEDRFRALVRRIRRLRQRPLREVREEAPSKKTERGKKPEFEEMAPRDRLLKIRELTGRLIEESGEGNRAASLKIALKALDHAKILYEQGKKNEQLGPLVKRQLSLTHYNVACMYSLMNKKDKAFAHLEKTVELGPFDNDSLADQIEGDKDFDNIRTDRRYAALLRRARGGKESKQAEMSEEERREKVGRLMRTMIEAADDKRYEEALEAALAIRELNDNAVSNYNVACMYSLRHKADLAFKYLNIAIEKGGFPGDIIEQMEGDSDLDTIRKDRRYAEAVEKARKKQRSERRRGRRRTRQAERTEAREEKTAEFRWKVTLPKDYDESRKAPLLVALHHYHGSMNRTTERWKEAADAVGAVLLTPQGTIDMGNGQFHWGRDLDVIEKNVMAAINEVLDRYRIDQDRIVLAGFSQGAWATWALALRNPDTFCGIIPVCGRVDAKSDAPFEDEDLGRMRVFVMIGEEENSQVLDMNRRAVERFRKIGAKVKLKVYEDVGHGFPENETEEQIKALRYVLGA